MAELCDRSFSLISTAKDDACWMSEADILALYQSQTRFIDITDGDLASLAANSPPVPHRLLLEMPFYFKIFNGYCRQYDRVVEYVHRIIKL
ncbi:hypothetical protein HK100_003050 [Physocladia obscura]|uniref:Uncharacterized protein n=1 Tax=Physocladia obscura TaxID=109957 RepID=A0AAD5SVF1_9FUNG|nr:hypothetical protein HK100_003050 [Physocladia obscura]